MARRAFLAILLTALSLLLALPHEAAFAQTPPGDIGNQRSRPPPPPTQRGGFLDLLFGSRLFQPTRPPPGFRVAPGNPFFRGTLAPPGRPAEPPLQTVEVVPKEPGAKKILVLGDFVAGGLAWGLDQSFATEPKLAVVDRSNNSSGLVRPDYYDWNAELLNILNTEKPDIVVIALGTNDRQQMRVGNTRIAPRSEAWEKTYVERVTGMADTLKIFRRPFFWIGAPPMRLAAASADMAYLNELYRPIVTQAGGDFIDIWNGFTNENGRYISSGPDVDGQLRALRSGDGINFTRAGRLKLAFYVQREIRRQTGIGTGAVDLLASVNQSTQIEIGPDGQKRLVGPIISLSDPLPGASDALAGAPGETPPKEGETPQYLMIVKGVALPAVPGRADDFAWPPKPGPQAAAAPPPPTAAAN
jgi:uncharacterized protein